LSVVAALTGSVLVAPVASASISFVVTTTADDGPGSLRQAIVDANTSPGLDTISFDSFALGGSPAVIQPVSALPPITDPVIIDATGGGCSGAAPSVVLDGTLGPTTPYNSVPGLTISAGGSTVRGLAIRSFNGPGVLLNSNGNTLECNGIGMGAEGISAAANTYGVQIQSGSSNVVGGTTDSSRNVVSGNFDGVTIFGASSNNIIEQNYIGTNVSGTAAIPNGNYGVDVGSSGNIVRNNVISGNYYGLEIANASSTVIQGNLIGTDASGANRLGNQVIGMEINQSPNTVVGGAQAGEGNVISGTGGASPGEGLRVFVSPGTTVKGNLIGTDASGARRMGNTADGIDLLDTTNTTIGGAPGEGNVIVDSGSDGISVSGCLGAPPSCSSPADSNVIQGNHIGVDLNYNDLGNVGAGIRISQASNTTIGGPGGAGNEIGFNATGVSITGTAPGNTVSGNAIDLNSGLGIDLGGDGVTLNDAADGDTGPNGLQNFPVLTSAATDGINTTVAGSLHSAPGTSYAVDVYASPNCDSTGYGEGRLFLGSTTASTDSSGDASLAASFAIPVQSGWAVAGTATDGSGNTSEFSACRAVTVAGPAITSLTPNSVQACTGGCGAITLQVIGSGFDASSVVRWDGPALATTLLSSTSLTATVPGSLLSPAGTHQIMVTNPAGGVSSAVPFFVTETGATIQSSSTDSGTDPTASTGTTGVTASATGTGTMTVSQYGSDPVSAPAPSGTSNFFDVNVPAGSSFTSLTVVDCAIDPANTSNVIYWWNGSQWTPVSNQTYDATTGCVTMTFTDLTSPTIAQLAGTVFADTPADRRTVSVGPANTEGTLRLVAGDWLSAGYEFKFAAKTKKATTVSLTNARLVLPVSCGNGAVGRQLVVNLAPGSYSVPAGSTSWLPTNDNNAPTGFQGAVQIANPCGTGVKITSAGATLTATLSTSPAGTRVSLALHYRDPRAKGGPNISCANPSANPAPGVKDCTAGWSTPATV